MKSELPEAEAIFRTMADHAPVLMWMSDANASCHFFNEGWLRFTGRDLEQEMGDGWSEGVHPDDLDRCLKRYREAFERREPFEMDYRLRRHDGEYRWVLDRGAPFYRPEGEFSGFIGACVDITERRQSRERLEANEMELHRLNRELEDRVSQRTKEFETANQELESFTYSVSHDLRAPLRTILGYANILLEDYREKIDDDGQQMLRRQIEAVRRMERLISDLLEYSKIGRHELVQVDFDLTRLAKDVAEEICNREWGCEARIDVALGLRAYGDPGLLRFALQNLFENSVKYSARTGTPRVNFGQEEDGTYYVRDNGVGFDMQYAKKLFQPFERLHSAKEFPGTGIGLANVKRIIERHGGKVWADGELGKGATFFFRLGG